MKIVMHQNISFNEVISLILQKIHKHPIIARLIGEMNPLVYTAMMCGGTGALGVEQVQHVAEIVERLRRALGPEFEDFLEVGRLANTIETLQQEVL